MKMKVCCITGLMSGVERLSSLGLISCCLLVSTLSSDALQSGDFTFETIEDETTIIGYTGSGGAVTVPSSLGGKPVRYIEASAFQGNATLTSIDLPSSLYDLHAGAFANCSSLTSANLGNGLYSIPPRAFKNCSNLFFADIHGKTTSIGEEAFSGCSALPIVDVSEITDIGYRAFFNCSSLVDFLEDTVVKIDDSAFAGCIALTNLTFESVTSVGDDAFSGCSALTDISIRKVTSIGDGAFEACTSLTNVAVGNSLQSLSNGAFYGCSSLECITLPSSVTSMGRAAFYDCSQLKHITFLGSTAPTLGSDPSPFTGLHAEATIVYPLGGTNYAGNAAFGGISTHELPYVFPDYSGERWPIPACEVQMVWPDGSPYWGNPLGLGDDEFVIGNVQVTSPEGRVNWHEVMANAELAEEDVIYMNMNNFSTNYSVKLSMPPVHLGKAFVEGKHVLDLCEPARELVKAISDYKREYKFYRDLEVENRRVLTAVYNVKKGFFTGKWHVEVETDTQKWIDLCGDIVTIAASASYGGTPWRVAFADAALDEFIGIPGSRDLMQGQYKQFGKGLALGLLTEVVNQLAYQATRAIYTSLFDEGYDTKVEAQTALYQLQSDMMSQRLMLEPGYNQMREDYDDIHAIWERLYLVPEEVRDHSGNPEQCIPSHLMEAWYDSPVQLEEFPSINLDVIITPYGSWDFLYTGETVQVPFDTLLPQPQRVIQSDLAIASTYAWTKLTPSGIEVIGEQETLLFSSFSEADAGTYRRVEFNELGEVVDSQTFSLYLNDASVTPPSVTSEFQTLLAFTNTSFIYSPEVTSTGITSFAWMKDETALHDNIPHLFISSVDEADEGMYSVAVENAGGAVTNDVFQLRVLKNPWDSFEIVSGDMDVGIATETNVLYGIQESTNLSTWVDTGMTVSGDGDIHSLSISTGSNDVKYIRISASPISP